MDTIINLSKQIGESFTGDRKSDFDNSKECKVIFISL